MQKVMSSSFLSLSLPLSLSLSLYLSTSLYILVIQKKFSHVYKMETCIKIFFGISKKVTKIFTHKITYLTLISKCYCIFNLLKITFYKCLRMWLLERSRWFLSATILVWIEFANKPHLESNWSKILSTTSSTSQTHLHSTAESYLLVGIEVDHWVKKICKRRETAAQTSKDVYLFPTLRKKR